MKVEITSPQSKIKTSQASLTDYLKDFFANILGQIRISKKVYPGVMHFLIFWGMTLLSIGHVVLLMQMTLFTPIVLNFPKGNTYLVFETISDFAGIALLFGLFLAAIRRILLRPAYLESSWEDYYALIILGLIPIVGYINEAIRITATSPEWASRSPVGNMLAVWLKNVGLSAQQASALHLPFVIFHVAIGLLFIASIPFTKLRHLVITPANILLRPRRKSGELEKIEDLENSEILGAGKIDEFATWQLISFDACLRCGRCEEICPVAAVGMNYSPKNLIQSLRESMHRTLINPITNQGQNGYQPDALGDQESWHCTTCGACTDICPAFVNPVDQIISLRRYQVLSTGKMPKTVGDTLRKMERQGNPWGLPPQEKTKWAEGLNIPIADPEIPTDVLLWFGCALGFDERNKTIARSIVNMLSQLEISYAALYQDEGCCGETARRMGHEYVFQVMAETNIEILNEFNFQRIVTPCPHCFNTLKNEYPQFGANYQVQHLSELWQENIDQMPNSDKNGHSATFHDPCYLGRYNQVFSPPRELLARTELSIVEMSKKKQNSFCCGGGGGQMWMETDAETRINHQRLQDAIETKAEYIITACPYCLTMFEDAIGAKGLQDQIEVLDITEALIRERIE